MSQAGENRFTRIDEKFYSAPLTKEAIEAVLQRRHTVIYCGAGVSADRTGLGWQSLIDKLQPNSTKADTDDMKLLSRFLDTQRQATAAIHRFDSLYGEESRERAEDVVRRELYRGRSQWEWGELTRHIAWYAVMRAASTGGTVTILTTNFDTYLENELHEIDKKARRVFKSEAPKVIPRVDLAEVLSTKPEPAPDHATVELVYLHGRTGPSADDELNRPLVLDEIDYGKTTRRTVEILCRYMNVEDSSFIIVGASLTDPPLISALALSRETSHFQSNHQHRIFLMSVSSIRAEGNRSDSIANLEKHEGERLVELLRGRCRRLGLSMLTPNFKYQVAQFFQELILRSGSPEIRLPDYGVRQTTWWRGWESAGRDSFHHSLELYIKLKAKVQTIQDAFGPDNAERFKLELWVRSEPPDERLLALYASSAGVLYDRDILRREELSIASPQPAMRAYVDGQVQHIDSPPDVWPHSRWRSFLSVPIFLWPEELAVWAGVLTLASTCDVDTSCLPKSDRDLMKGLVDDLRTLGFKLLQPPPSE